MINSESLRIADQLQRAFTGDPWHGSPLRDLLSGVTARDAQTHLFASSHSIWELVLHIQLYVDIAIRATEGIPMPKLFGTEKDWPSVTDESEGAWTAAKDQLFNSGELLVQSIRAFEDARLQDPAPGRDYDFYILFHGVVQHSLYHGGQIAMIGKAILATRPSTP